ncbi:LysM peptidoglycan-binding domain-containing protein [Paenibacillus ehimensis]|uniref:LysM peptidoglycan-binding domain-containing protein n=1 Tax=Paenibacillus ehimensis TaxID=79264 RepID=A0ABT8VI25_9BACL|nr:LysM peptidoglycan-binding domain-containing protein [Paenibacillus ehimensis]MDO3680640.1 LysM peptidoglycan-binding domain-containing protein [Paenibacillus ehimensis]
MRVAIGEFELKDWEKPDFINRGGEQMLAIRPFPGGSVSIQDMGPSYRPITWSGMFIGIDAYDRMMTLGLMRTAGKPVEFSCDKFSFPIVIKEFYPDYKSDTRIPFTITLIHVVDLRQKSATQLVDSIDKAAVQYAEATSEQKQGKIYVVKDGDTLWKIARTQTEGKNANLVDKIYQDNLDVLTDGPNWILPGMELKINV